MKPRSLPLNTILTPPALPILRLTSVVPVQVCVWPAFRMPSKAGLPSTSTRSQASWVILAVTCAAGGGVAVAASEGVAVAMAAGAELIGVAGTGVGVGMRAAALFAAAGDAARKVSTWR